MLGIIGVIDDGGREKAGYPGKARDCVVRAISIVTKTPYGDVHSALNSACIAHGNINVDKVGTPHFITRKYMKMYGGKWTSMSKISKHPTYLVPSLFPKGRIIAHIRHHVVPIIDGVIHDIGDPVKKGKQKVYGYWRFKD